MPSFARLFSPGLRSRCSLRLLGTGAGRVALASGSQTREPPITRSDRGFSHEVGDDVLSHRAAPAVPSALQSLTAVFGMGTGVSSAPLPPTIRRLNSAQGGVEASVSFGATYLSIRLPHSPRSPTPALELSPRMPEQVCPGPFSERIVRSVSAIGRVAGGSRHAS